MKVTYFSKILGEVIPKLLYELCSGNMTPTQHLEKQQALVKQFAEILEFVLKFDEHKVSSVVHLIKIECCLMHAFVFIR